MVVAGLGGALIGIFVKRRKDANLIARSVLKVVPFTGDGPPCREVIGRWVGSISHLDIGFLNSRKVGEVGPSNEITVEIPIVRSVSGGVHAGISSSIFDVLFEGGLLAVVKNVSGRVEPYYRIVLV